MVDPVAAWSAFTARYGPIAAGLIIGTAGKYGLTLSEGGKITLRGVIGDLLLLGILGLIAVEIADWCALKGDMRVGAGALAAVSSDRLVRLVRDRFMRRVEDDLGAGIRTTEGLARVKGGHTPATTTKIMQFKNADPRTAAFERMAEDLMPTAKRPDLDKLARDASDAIRD